MNFLVFFFITTVVAEWELPFEINVNFLKHIGGFSPLLNSTYVPKKNFLPDRETLQPLTGNRSILLGSSILFSSSSSCEWNCFDSSFFPSPLPIEIDPVNASSECPPYTPNEPIIPPIRLPSINADGSCSSFDHHILSHTNVSLSCFIPFRGLPIDPLKCDLVDTVLLSFWSQLDLPDALCNCDRCTVPLVELNSTRNETDSACYITTGIEISITHREGKINSFILR
ncbi:hypothetical protein PFISCL1PPCAC_10703 [Pristionchus fissidentatus]|uniref:Uncharacterized protein n=1 Tax=Pristionchus fissidentatus TaxID=1538716 RepID=A0AAV5VJ41_9BILA|nr:hypothetical protein PFISCL1PPCAC_10703 [Pristionchus fissidentatus]